MSRKPFESKEARINYLKGLIRISKCDGNISPEEKRYFSLAAQGFELSDKDVQELDSLWTKDEIISLSFEEKYDAVFFLQEALQLVLIDGRYDELEKQELLAIAIELKILEKDFRKIESWALAGIAWKKQGEQIIEEIAKEETR